MGSRATAAPAARSPLPAAVLERTVPALLQRRVAEQGGEVATIAHSCYQSEQRLTFAELSSAASRLASVLQAEGVGRGDRVGILVSNRSTADALITYHASHVLGAINVPYNGRYVKRELEYVLDRTQPKAVVFSPEFGPLLAAAHEGQSRPLLLEAAESPALGQDLRSLLEQGTAMQQVQLDEDEDADWIFTSGTTGHPKAVAITHASSVACGYQSQQLWGLDRRSVYSSSAPFFTSTGFHTNQLGALAAGCTYVCELDFDVGDALARLQRYGVTSTFFISGMLELLLRRYGDEALAAVDLGPLERLCYGGQPMPAPFYRRVDELFRQRHGLQLVHLYGLTEGGTSGLKLPPERHARAVERAGRHGLAIGSEGFNAWVEYAVLGGNDLPVAGGEVGEICLRGPAVMDRYVDHPEETAAALRAGWLRTGDMGLVEDDLVYFVDRKRQMIRRGGLNIASAEVEGVLGECPGVVEVAVVPVPNPVLGEEVGAFVVADAGLTEEALLGFCRKNLADYKVPARVSFVDSLPRNAMGRVVKADLRFEPAETSP